MLKVACPCCGEVLSPEQMAELQQEMAEYGPAGAGEGAQDPMQAATMVDAMSRELDDPKKAAGRTARKE